MSGVVIDGEQAARRLGALYAAWKAAPEEWGGASCLLISRPPTADDEPEFRYAKSIALHLWLFGYEVPGARPARGPRVPSHASAPPSRHALPLHAHGAAPRAQRQEGCARGLRATRPLAGAPVGALTFPATRAASVLAPVQTAAAAAGLTVTVRPLPRAAARSAARSYAWPQFHVRPKNESGEAQLEPLLAAAASAGGPLAQLAKEKAERGLGALWAARWSGAACDASVPLARLLAVKDEQEQLQCKRAANLAAKVMDGVLVKQLEELVEREGRSKHSALAARVAAAALEPAKLGLKLSADVTELAFPVLLQSGGAYDLKWTAGSDDSLLAYDPVGVIVAQLGVRYKSYCATVGRSFLIDAPAAVAAAYDSLLVAHAAAIRACVAGAACSAVHAAAAAALRARPGGEELLPHLSKSLGFSTGLEYRDNAIALSPKCDVPLQAGMVLALSSGLADVASAGRALPGGKPFSLLLADTVMVAAAGAPAEQLTRESTTKASDIAYMLKDEGGAPAEAAPKAAAKPKPSAAERGRGEAAGGAAEARRKAQQEALGSDKNAELAKRLTDAQARNAAAASSSGAKADFVAYRSAADVPSERARESVIQVDRAREALLLPISGQLVPFHIGTVKNATASAEGAAHFIRIHFNVPGGGFGGGGYAPAVANPEATFVREVTYRTLDARHASTIVSEIKSLRAAAKTRATEQATRATLVKQEKLQLAKGRVYRLSDVWVRPAFGGRGRKLAGTLECHANGFRYSTPKSEERLDIIFANIKHAFFQPSDKELITLIHFHLHDPIMVGKKKTHDVQVFTEVMDAVQNLDGARRSMYDPDEIEDEQRERERRNRINAEFLTFTKRCQELWEKEHSALELEFDIPFKELGFTGVPHKTQSVVIPTVNCLVDLVELPFLVITLADIEVVNLERVSFALKNFDMAIVFKDFTRDVHRIDAIDMRSLDTIKEWLTSVNVKYYESKMNLNWKPILKTILDDPIKFVEDGGWNFLDLEGADTRRPRLRAVSLPAGSYSLHF